MNKPKSFVVSIATTSDRIKQFFQFEQLGTTRKENLAKQENVFDDDQRQASAGEWGFKRNRRSYRESDGQSWRTCGASRSAQGSIGSGGG
ncbi:hypothetical protein [Nostoc sp. DedQUE12b]|uniref:hypothetical protein n=1 Tax=Nostoc sp. DedQUE12b TaxID=3075398 RepID=UPI002AD39CCC|nr:hypothetical protein [Nostoc sp. DedQUE12b]